MTARQNQITLRHLFAGGWATDFGTSTQATPDASGIVQMQFLVDAENCLYEFDGGPRKIPGTTKLNSVQMESGAVIKGLFDFWLSGTGGSSTQHRIVHVGTKVKKDDADGTFTDIGTGLTSGSIPSYAVLEDLLILANEDDIPKSWDGTTFTESSAWPAGAPPNFSIVETHKNRIWAAGIDATPSRLIFSDLLDPDDFVAGSSGFIDIDPDDGDRITGIASHRNELFVFKGPQKGSIHRITGSAPTGADAFARIEFASGIGAAGHNSIFRFADDIGFVWSDGSIRTLSSTERFGDYLAAAVSAPINFKFLNERVNLARLKHSSAAYDDIRNTVCITLPIDGSTDNNAVICCDFRFRPPRWSFIPALAAGFIASVIDPTDVDKRIIMLGGNDGHVRKWNQTTRDNDGSAISYKVTTPFINYGQPFHLKTISAASISISSTNATDLTFGWISDDNPLQQQQVNIGGTEGLLDSFVLDTDQLQGSSIVDKFLDLETGGKGRQFQYQLIHNAADADAEVHGINTLMEVCGISTEN